MGRRSLSPRADVVSLDPSLDGLLCFAIYSAGLAFGRVYRPYLESAGLTYPQYLVMMVLWGRDDRTVGDLCETLMLTTSTMTPVLKKLEARGLLRRVRGPDDEREVRIVLAEAGVALKAEVCNLPDCIRAAAGIDPETMQTLQTAVSSLRDQLLGAVAQETRPSPRTRHRRLPQPKRAAAGTRASRRQIIR